MALILKFRRINRTFNAPLVLKGALLLTPLAQMSPLCDWRRRALTCVNEEEPQVLSCNHNNQGYPEDFCRNVLMLVDQKITSLVGVRKRA